MNICAATSQRRVSKRDYLSGSQYVCSLSARSKAGLVTPDHNSIQTPEVWGEDARDSENPSLKINGGIVKSCALFMVTSALYLRGGSFQILRPVCGHFVILTSAEKSSNELEKRPAKLKKERTCSDSFQTKRIFPNTKRSIRGTKGVCVCAETLTTHPRVMHTKPPASVAVVGLLSGEGTSSLFMSR